ncbi:MAG: flagellar basal body rod protein FlgC [Myxococcota bacterium]
MLKGFSIAAAGMSAQRVRMNLVSSNLANVSTTRTEGGGPYQRKEAIFRTTYASGADPFEEPPPAEEALRGVEVSEVRRDATEGPLVWDPDHPDADEDGNVRMPNVNAVEEMVDMITASRSFEANATSFQTLRDMAVRALQIGR